MNCTFSLGLNFLNCFSTNHWQGKARQGKARRLQHSMLELVYPIIGDYIAVESFQDDHTLTFSL